MNCTETTNRVAAVIAIGVVLVVGFVVRLLFGGEPLGPVNPTFNPMVPSTYSFGPSAPATWMFSVPLTLVAGGEPYVVRAMTEGWSTV